MSEQAASNLDIPPIVRRKLCQVRREIRVYIWLEALAALAIALGTAFWAGMLLDWLLEPPPGVRLAAIALVLGICGWIVYRWWLRRAFAPIPDASLAVLLERRFGQLHDHVLTSVDLARGGATEQQYPEFVSRTHYAAAQAIANVPTLELFQRGRLARALIFASALAVSIPVFAIAAGEAFGVWLDRVALSPEPWPRRVQLIVEGFPSNEEGQRMQKVARDDDFELRVRAKTDSFVAPDSVEFRFRLADGSRGRDAMIRVGESTPGRKDDQLYRYELKHRTADMLLEVIGGDDRVRDLMLKVVDRPELIGMEIECAYPAYLQRPARRLPVVGGMRIPEGSQLTFHAAATKPLTRVEFQSTNKLDHRGQMASDTPREEIAWQYGQLTTDDVLTVNVTDTDGIECREPYRVSLSAVPDEPPLIAIRLAGIGTAITQEAVLPITGQITDDYGLERVWFSYQVDDGPTLERPFERQPSGQQTLTQLERFDTRDADEPSEERALQLNPGQTLRLSVQATDSYDLAESPRAGRSAEFVLEIVSVSQLLALLERRELELRQRFEAIIAKVTDTRNLLNRVDFGVEKEEELNDVPAGETQQLEAVDIASPANSAERALSRRRLRLAGALQNVTQSAHEVLGVAEGFDDIHDQLENNRIDNSDLKSRIREQIALPLLALGENRMTDLASRLQFVERQIADAEKAMPALADSVKLADEILAELQHVLERMLELESYNEVVALLRGIIHDQAELSERTKQRQTDRLQDLLSD